MTALNSRTTTVIDRLQPEALSLAERIIREGGCAVIPTETIYGLTCRALDAAAVKSLYAIKGRELVKPSAVFIAEVDQFSTIAESLNESTKRIALRFLPGPLTLVLRSQLKAVPGVVGDDGKIGVRVSSSTFVRELCKRIGEPLIATSANRAGEADCRTHEEVLSAFRGIVPLIVIENSPLTERATTVVDLTADSPVLIREGTIAFADVLNCAEGRS